jgi:hypothetical protein
VCALAFETGGGGSPNTPAYVRRRSNLQVVDNEVLIILIQIKLDQLCGLACHITTKPKLLQQHRQSQRLVEMAVSAKGVISIAPPKPHKNCSTASQRRRSPDVYDAVAKRRRIEATVHVPGPMNSTRPSSSPPALVEPTAITSPSFSIDAHNAPDHRIINRSSESIPTYVPSDRSPEWKVLQHEARVSYWSVIKNQTLKEFNFSTTAVPGHPFKSTLTPFKIGIGQVEFLSDVTRYCNHRFCSAPSRILADEESDETVCENRFIYCIGVIEGGQPCPCRLHPRCGFPTRETPFLRHCQWCLPKSQQFCHDLPAKPSRTRRRSTTIECTKCHKGISALSQHFTLPYFGKLDTWGGGQKARVRAKGGKMDSTEMQQYQESLTRTNIHTHCQITYANGKNITKEGNNYTEEREPHVIFYEVSVFTDYLVDSALRQELFDNKPDKPDKKSIEATAVYTIILYTLLNQQAL